MITNNKQLLFYLGVIFFQISGIFSQTQILVNPLNITECFYDGDNNILSYSKLSCLSLSFSDEKLRNQWRDTGVFDSCGNLIFNTRYSRNFSCMFKRKFNIEGQITEEKKYSLMGGYSPVEKKTFFYDSLERLVKENSSFQIGVIFDCRLFEFKIIELPSTYKEYFYNEKSQLSEIKEFTEISKKKTKLIKRNLFEYDEFGNEAIELQYNSNNNIEYKEERIYNSKNKLIHFIRYEYNIQIVTNEIQSFYTVDDVLVKTSVYSLDTEEEGMEYYSERLYDDGNVIELFERDVYDPFSPENCKEFIETTYNEYDENGDVINSHKIKN